MSLITPIIITCLVWILLLNTTFSRIERIFLSILSGALTELIIYLIRTLCTTS